MFFCFVESYLYVTDAAPFFVLSFSMNSCGTTELDNIRNQGEKIC